MNNEDLKKIIWEWGTSGVSYLEIIIRLKEQYSITMTEEELNKFIDINFRRKNG